MDTKPLLTLAETSTFLDIRPGTQDERVSVLIAAATASLERLTGRYFTRQAFTEYLTTRDNQRTDYDFRAGSDYVVPTSDVGGMRTIVTPQSVPLVGVAVDPTTLKLWYDPRALHAEGSHTQQELTVEEFALDAECDRVHLYLATRFRMRALKVTYEAGFEASAASEDYPDEITLSASIPDWLRSAALIQCQFLNVKLRRENINMMTERTTSDKGKVAVSAFAVMNGVTPEALPLVAHLKRPGVGRG